MLKEEEDTAGFLGIDTGFECENVINISKEEEEIDDFLQIDAECEFDNVTETFEIIEEEVDLNDEEGIDDLFDARLEFNNNHENEMFEENEDADG